MAASERPHSSVGPYRLGDVVGQGAAGVVFRAEDPSSGAPVAIKCLRTEHLSATRRRRIGREVRAVARLQHPNVVPILGAEHEGARPYIVMAWVPGPTLADRLRGGALPLPELAALAVGLGRALHAAHSAGVIHRDIKPGNVILREDASGPEAVVVCDFGLAKMLDEASTADPTTHEGAILGTPAYMAPEQGRCDTVDARADLYAAGVVLFEAASGRRPFVADSTIAMLMKHAAEPPPPLGELAPQLPAELVRLVHAYLQKEPEERPSSALPLIEQFSPYLEGGAPSAGPVLLAQPAPPRRRAWVMGGLAASLGLGAAAWSLMALRPEPAPIIEVVPSPRETPTPTPVAVIPEPAEQERNLDGKPSPPDTVETKRRAGAERSKPRRRLAARKPRTAPKPAPLPEPEPSTSDRPVEATPVIAVPREPSEADALETVVPEPPGKNAVEAEPAKTAPKPPPAPHQLARLEVRNGSRGRISALLGTALPEFRSCAAPEDGTIRVRARIGFSGRPSDLQITGTRARACFEAALRKVRFPRPDTGTTDLDWTLEREEP